MAMDFSKTKQDFFIRIVNLEPGRAQYMCSANPEKDFHGGLKTCRNAFIL